MDKSIFLLKAISDILTAGGAITAFSLFVYCITFPLKDRVTKSFTFLLACIVIILGTDAFFTTTTNSNDLIYLLRLQYIGLIFLPTAYFYFSDALLAITGKPSKGKRRIFGYVSLAVCILFIILNFAGKLFSNVEISNSPFPFIQRTIYFDFFTAFFIILMAAAWYNFVRSVQRTSTRQSKRRMLYLIVSALAPALGSFPYLLYGSGLISSFRSIFWMVSAVAYFSISISMMLMTYTVSFFGFAWPDRVIKSRLFKWLMRGPVTAILTLGITTLVSRLSVILNIDLSAIEILSMVAVIIIFEISVTIFSPYWERFLFSGDDKRELDQMRSLEDKLLTKNDLRQFLELILASFCDQLQISDAVLQEDLVGDGGISIRVGKEWANEESNTKDVIDELQQQAGKNLFYEMHGSLYFPIRQDMENEETLLGFIATAGRENFLLEDEKRNSIQKILGRASAALADRRQQESLLNSLDILSPQVSAIQSLLANSRFNRSKIINGSEVTAADDFEKNIKEALSHFFGGPKLSKNPLISLNVVQSKLKKEGETGISALRAVLKLAISRLRPVGDRQYTNEWVLFNILDMKFIEGWKVKEICQRLSLSEADFYRKQRVAIEAVADQLTLMEQESV